METLAGYTRVSRVGNRRDTLISHTDQRKRILDFAASRGLNVEMQPEESDVSGGKVDRPILSATLAAIEEGRYAGIIVAQLDRLSRMDIVDALKVIRHVESDAVGGQVIAVAENFDGTPAGQHARTMFLANAQFQLDGYKAQFARSKAQAVDRGIWPVPVVPIGYRKGKDRRLVPDKRTRAKVVRAFEARAAGSPWREVAAILGVGMSAAGKVIRNRVYLGEIRMGELSNPAAHDPIVPRDLWEAAQQSHPRPARRQGEPRALLAGRVYCAGCGGALTPNTSVKPSGIERIYRCNPNNKAGGRCEAPAIISQAKLDPYVEALALEEIGRLALTARERTEALDVARKAVDAAEAELAAYEAVTEITGAGGVGADAFVAARKLREEAVEVAQARAAEARAAVGTVFSPQTLRGLWPKLSVEQRGHVLRDSLGAVWVRRGRGPCPDRVRVVAPGYGPPKLAARARMTIAPLAWDADLDGEIRPAVA